MTHDPRVIELLQRWESAREEGQPLTLEELCREHPDLLPQVQRGIEALRSLEPMIDLGADGPTSPYAGPPPTLPDGQLPAGDSMPGTRYRLLRFHDRGGVGEIFIAEDVELHREVALKRVQGRLARDPHSLRRFQREAEITGRLEHPGIVPVYGLVRDEHGSPCYAMRLVQGQTLRDALRRLHQPADQANGAAEAAPLTLRQLLNRFVTVCNTVAYAHSRGIVHRDLKPGNIMLGHFGETLVMDWGLARSFRQPEGAGPVIPEAPVLAEDAAAEAEGTRLGHVVGTPPYMSPEQASGRWDVVGPASDVYSLGATLYALLTGQSPFPDRRDPDVLEKVQRGGCPRPVEINPATPPALEAICLKAMALRPEDRYASALDLAADVEHWLADEPVSAYRELLRVRLGRWARQHNVIGPPPLLSGAAAVLLLTVVVLATVLAVVLWGR